MESYRNLTIQKVKSRPNSYIYKLSLPAWAMDVLNIDIESYSRGYDIDKKVKISESGGKIIIEKAED